MLRHPWLIAALGGLLFLPLGLSYAGGEKKEKTPNYYPLELGNAWTYELNANGNLMPMVSKIAKIETIDGVKLARLEAVVNNQVNMNEHLEQNAKGIFRHRMNGIEVSPPLMLLKYPFKAGDKWSGEFEAANSKAKFTCETAEETIDVQAGKFKTAKVSLVVVENGQTVSTTYWFAQDVGFVKQTLDLGGVNVIAELQKFEKKK